ncbi:MAG: FtsX-like permease family protein [Gammaproteobacteria bacterium]|nr:MAG: FtsX-like permease family protein [Gammaproteobacteria bacterium]
MLALNLLIRNWRSGELKLLSISIVLAVAVLSAISIFTDRLGSTLMRQSNALLGADIVVESSKSISQEWIDQADAAGLQQARTIEFASMVFAGEEMHLAAIKAVERHYPLRGQLDISQVSFAVNPVDIKRAEYAPARGEIWLDSRLLAQLKVQLGEKLSIGELELIVTQVLIREPESRNPFSSISPRILMNIDDVPATQVIKAGSRVDYSWLLASDKGDDLENFLAWLKPQLTKHEKLQDINSSQDRLSKTLESGKNFLLFAAVIAVLLAGVAIAIAARQFSDRHTNQVALMKSLGVSASKIRRLYFTQLFVLGVIASVFGLLIGYGIQTFVALNLEKNYHFVLNSAHLSPYLFSFVSGLICITFFALPALWFLPAIPPLKILRKELAISGLQVWIQAALAFVAVIFLVALFSQNLRLTASVSAALIIIVIISFAFSWLLLAISKKLSQGLGGFGRLAFANLQRRKSQSLVQIMVFSVAIMLLLTLTILRTSLIDDWRAQIPVNSPNHFLINISPSDVNDVSAVLAAEKITSAPLYPMIRGRLMQINGKVPDDEMAKNANALQREVNLTESETLADDNKIIKGEWWDKWTKSSLPGVSVEEAVAKSLNLALGDKLLFSLGGLELEAEVASIRTLNWKSMRPNFFFIFEPQSLKEFSPTFMTSIFLAPDQKIFINQLLHKYPTITVMELDRIIEQIRSIVNQVSDGVGLVLLLTLAAGAMVLFAAVMSSIDSRKQEAGLLRALGSPQKLILGSVLVEFVVLGILAGLIAIFGAEALLFSMQKFVFNNPIKAHLIYWFIAPVGSAIFIGALGVICCRPVVSTPPMVVLRDAT